MTGVAGSQAVWEREVWEREVWERVSLRQVIRPG